MKPTVLTFAVLAFAIAWPSEVLAHVETIKVNWINLGPALRILYILALIYGIYRGIRWLQQKRRAARREVDR